MWARHSRVVAGVALVCVLGAHIGSAATPSGPGTADFDRIAMRALEARRAPGFSFAVVKDGAIVYASGWGVADLEKNVPVETQTRFAVGSLTKQFTAAAILLLAQRGNLSLDDPLASYVPSIPNAARITLRMLLNQTSGLHNYPLLSEHEWPQSGPIDLASVISILGSDRSDFAPGSRWAYSNANYAVLAAVIAKASGLDEAAFLQQNVFAPLHMNGSGFGYAAQHTPPLAKPYRGKAPYAAQPEISLDLYSGAGAVVSTAPDLAAWDVALMAGTMLGPESMKALWSPGTLADGTAVPYAMGFVPGAIAGHRELAHAGLVPGAGGYCYNAIFPDDGLAVVVLSNGYDFDGIAEQMVASVLIAYDPDAAAAQIPTTAPSPAPGADAAITARAKDWFRRLQTGSVDLSQVDRAFADRLTPELLAQIQLSLKDKGDPTDWIYLGSRSVPRATISTYWIRVDGVPHEWSVGLTPDGKIAGSLLR